MKAVIQRVSKASVELDPKIKRTIGIGMVILLGIETADDQSDIEWLTRKILNLRIFADKHGLMNKSLIDEGGEILLISQFTLHASTKKGNRPSFIKAAKPSIAMPLYNEMIEAMENMLGKKIITGEFGAQMLVTLSNDGPVTIVIDSKKRD